MRSVLLPGYAELIGGPVPTYEDLVKDLPSDVVITLAVSLNNELSGQQPEEVIQKKILQAVSFRFSPNQVKFLTACIQRYAIKTNGKFQGHFFETRYFLEMILRELNRNAQFPIVDSSPEQEYNFLLAYWVIVDETNSRDTKVLNDVIKQRRDADSDYRLLWGPMLNQFQFNESANVPFEIYKLTCFLVYCTGHLRPYLKEYLNQMGFEKIGQLLGSFHQIVMSTTVSDENELLSRLTYIQPRSEVDLRHLDSQTINRLFGLQVTLPDIKKFPLFKKDNNRYMVIDNDLYYKKVYRGPFFELRAQTSLKDQKGFVPYSSDIAKEVMEQIVFRAILGCMHKGGRSVPQFDDGTEGAPDGYFRRSKRMLLFEFKGYLFPDSLPEEPQFEAVRKYLDERFVTSSAGSPKGVTQLAGNIQKIIGGYPAFDKELSADRIDKKLVLYPILSFDEFYFTLPGVNSYLNRELLKLLPQKTQNKIDIRPLTLINLDILFHLCILNQSLDQIFEMCDRYHSILGNRKRKYEKTGQMNDFLAANASFDEVFKTIFLAEINKVYPPAPLNCLLEKGGVVQGKLEEVL